MIKKLMPSDTRATELISGFSLILSSILLLYGGNSYIPDNLKLMHHWAFWSILFFIFGSFQIIAIYKEWDAMIRAILSWVVGIYWLWVGVGNLCIHNPDINYILLLVLGASCQYSYIVNLLFSAKKSWT